MLLQEKQISRLRHLCNRYSFSGEKFGELLILKELKRMMNIQVLIICVKFSSCVKEFDLIHS